MISIIKIVLMCDDLKKNKVEKMVLMWHNFNRK